MIKKKTVLIFTLVLSILFSVGYTYISLKYSNLSNEFYVVQVGVFSSDDNASNLIEQLKKLQKDTYTYKKDELIYVLTCISRDKKEVEEQMKWLVDNKINNVKRTYNYSGSKNLNSLDTDDLLAYLEQ